jgi:dienelactone hydrolase
VRQLDLDSVNNAAEWAGMRARIERRVLRILGPFPRSRAPLEPAVLAQRHARHYTRSKVSYQVETGERVPAWLFIPDPEPKRAPAILCPHQTVPQGKDEPAGISGKRSLAFAAHYARLGYVTLAPDSITAGERVYPGWEPYETEPFYRAHPKWSAMGKMAWDHMRALDYLCTLGCVDQRRLGCIGHSLGGYNAFFLAAFDERVKACVASCSFTPFRADENPMRWARTSWFCHFPALRPHIERRRYPFDFEHVFALIAPRALLLITGLNDPIFPQAWACDESVRIAAHVWDILGARVTIRHHVHSRGHRITRAGQEAADLCFHRHLGGQPPMP